MIRRALVRLGLCFAEDAKERLFVERFILVHRRTSQLFLLPTGVLFCLFFLWDRAVDPVHWRTVFPFREFVLAPFIFAPAALLVIPRVRPYLETLISITLTICLGGFALICANLDNGFRYGGAGMLLIYFGGASLFPLRVTFLVIPSLTSMFGFLILQAVLGRAPDMMVVNPLLIFSAVMIVMLSTAGREFAARREFLTDGALAEARVRVDDLLHSMMPREIVDRMQAGETTIADIHGEVSIVFADLVGFTALSRQLSASQLVHMLNTVFSRFDTAAGRLGIEKIKTIGDAYMAVGGLSTGDDGSEHAARMADFALAMRDITAELAKDMELPIAVRIGLHVGPVVAGVIGVKKPAFDCWGAAVNMASRLEAASRPGVILISESSHDRLRDEFLTEASVDVDLKGIGPSKVYLLHGRRRAAWPPGSGAVSGPSSPQS